MFDELFVDVVGLHVVSDAVWMLIRLYYVLYVIKTIVIQN